MSLTKDDLQEIKTLLEEQSKELKQHTTDSIDALARNILEPSFSNIEQRLDAIENILVEDRLPMVEKELEKLQTFRAVLKNSKLPTN